MPVNVHYNYTAYLIPPKKNLVHLAGQVIHNEQHELGDVNIILTDNPEILDLNRKYLQHDYYTDVIAFPYNKSGPIEGDVFISLDKVHENSIEYSTGFENELIRVIVHGLLHLIGYTDDNTEEKESMHRLEDHYIQSYYLKYR
jgi:rRNA maturation RNase YbeY